MRTFPAVSFVCKTGFYDKVLSTNLTAMVGNATQQQVDKATAHRRHDYQVNFAQALSKMKNIIAALLGTGEGYK